MQRMNSDLNTDAALIERWSPIVRAAGFDVDAFGAAALYDLAGVIIADEELTLRAIASRRGSVLPHRTEVLPTLSEAERQALPDRIRSKHPHLFGK